MLLSSFFLMGSITIHSVTHLRCLFVFCFLNITHHYHVDMHLKLRLTTLTSQSLFFRLVCDCYTAQRLVLAMYVGLCEQVLFSALSLKMV